jgi:NAD(P)-dependent dehydrogenase (short-subunit alcohol dehydrogenase family)
MYKVLVTGGTKGIGLAIAELLKGQGHDVVTCARDENATVQCDVSRPEQVEAMREQIGPVDVLINNAGGVRTAPFLRLSEEDWDWHFQLNIKSVFYCTKAFLPAMVEKKWGRIINIASTAGKVGGSYITAYSASKHAVVGLTRALAQEVAESGVTVNAVCPSFVDTPMLRESLKKVSQKTGKTEEEIVTAFQARSPLKRLVTPQEVALTVEFLIANGGINGQAISVCGGETFS